MENRSDKPGAQEHVWLTPAFSVRRETLCMKPKTVLPPGADWRITPRSPTGAHCLLGAGHKGAHKYAVPDIRLYSFREPQK
jgi:hypothetical protein